jgi:hypothetical protein
MDFQIYDPNALFVTNSTQLNDSVVLESILESGMPGVFSYRVRPFSSGFGGWSGHFVGTNYPHGDFINFPGISSNNNVVVDAVAVQSDKKIVVAGSYKVDSTYDVFVARFKFGTLTLDSTFGTNGIFRIVGTTQANTNKVYSLIVGQNDTLYATYKVDLGGFPYTASLNPNGSFNTNYTGGSVFTGQVPGFANSKLLNVLNDKLLVTANISTLGQILNNNGSYYMDLPNMANELPNYSNYIIRNVKANANGDLLLVGSVDTNMISRGLMVRLKKVLVTPSSISQIQKASYVNIYPNPATQSISFSLEKVEKNAHATIFSIDGKMVSAFPISNLNTTLNIGSITKGLYVLQIKNGEQLLTSKFIKE